MPLEQQSAQVQSYLESLVPQRPSELAAMEAHARATHFPIIGPTAGYVCYQLARMIGARRVFELGSGFGYSTAWFARAVQENLAGQGEGQGVVHHVVWDEELSRQARGHLHALGYGDIVRYHVGEAVAALSQTPGPFDLIFNDIDKQAYPASLPVIAAKLRPGGLLIVDNVLWSGRIFDAHDQNPATKGVREMTQLAMQDPDWVATILPIRDGLLVAFRAGGGPAT